MSFLEAYNSARLPIHAATDQIIAAVQGRRRFVLSASPGSGKTTLAPLLIRHLLDEGGAPGRILIAQPRRVAVRSAAKYVASLLGEQPGERVGWTMRGDRAVTSKTRIEFTTTGTLLRRLIANPDLPGVDALILDEVHERHLDSDLALAFALDVADLRDDLLLGVMSATADVSRFHALLASSADAVAIDAPGKQYPLDVVWTPATASLDQRGTSKALINHLAETAAGAFAAHGSTLVFAPSIRDVEEVASLVRARGVPTFVLHSGVSAREQDEALSSRGERVIVATDIAETSLTVPGVHCVVDSGLTRAPRFDVAREAAQLVTIRESRSSAVQRAGRAHRTGPGVVYRCYRETDFARMNEYASPEIESADLTEATLLAHAWDNPTQLRLPSPFPAPALERAEQTLERIGALKDGQIGEAGRQLAQVPLYPRAAHALLLATAWSGREDDVARIVAAMSGYAHTRATDIEVAAKDAPKQDIARLARIASEFSAAYAGEHAASVAREDLPGVVVGLAFPGRIAKRRERGEGRYVRYLSAAGTGLSVEAASPLSSDQWIAAAEILNTGGETKVLLGAALNPKWARQIGAGMLSETKEVELTDGRLRARLVQRIGAIQIGDLASDVPIDEARVVLADALRVRGLALFKPGAAAEELVRKSLYISSRDASWSELTNELLAEHVDELVGGAWPKLLAGAPLREVDLVNGLKTIIGWGKVAQIDQVIPTSIELPSGNPARVTFDPERGPTVRVKLQETFGFKEVPRVLGEPLTFELLSPAGRPLAITSDLETFFNETYAQVRAEMRGRYPKHPWPEDPWTTQATRKTNARLR